MGKVGRASHQGLSTRESGARASICHHGLAILPGVAWWAATLWLHCPPLSALLSPFGLRMGVKLLFRSDLRGGRLSQQPHPTELWGHQCVQSGPPGKRSPHEPTTREPRGSRAGHFRGRERRGTPSVQTSSWVKKSSCCRCKLWENTDPQSPSTRATHSFEFASSSRA